MADFRARVLEAGGGQVVLAVDRDTEEYPPIGSAVEVTIRRPRRRVFDNSHWGRHPDGGGS